MIEPGNDPAFITALFSRIFTPQLPAGSVIGADGFGASKILSPAEIRAAASADGEPLGGGSGLDGKTVRSGSGAPSNGLGVDGDFYINTAANTIYGPKTSGNWGSPTSLVGPAGATGPTGANGTNGTNGLDGKTVRSGSGAPSNGLGVDGDFYINTVVSEIYGPKTAGAWGSPTSLVGPAGSGGGGGGVSNSRAFAIGLIF
jgi:integrin beta 8